MQHKQPYKIMKYRIVLLCLVLNTIMGYAQQDSQFTQYMYNTVTINPAYTASREALSIFAMHRAQWVGLDGAPSTSMVSLSTPIKGRKLGLGVLLSNDKVGPSENNVIETNFSYTIPTSPNYQFSFGLKASIGFLNVDFSKLDQYNPSDYAFQDDINNSFSPNIGVGAYFYSDNSYYGISIPRILETTYYNKYADAGSVSTNVEKPSIYLIAGKVYDFGNGIKLKPSVLAKYVSGTPLAVDLSGNVLFGEVFTLGLAYRWNAAVSALAGFQVSSKWFIGYSYDMATTEVTNFSYGSHEIFLRFELFKKHEGVTSPRFF